MFQAMPIYEYRCSKGHEFEVMRSISADPLTTCETCSAPVERVFRPIAVHFKGSGFYNTDYGTKKRSREMKESKEASKSESSKDSSGSKDSKDSKSSSGSGSDSGGSDSGSKPSKSESPAGTASGKGSGSSSSSD
jgi:putative FmdB family regulatory protein